MKSYFYILTTILICFNTSSGYAAVGEGTSNPGSLTSIINHAVGEGISDVGTLTSIDNSVTNTIIITHGYTAEELNPLIPIIESRWEHFVWQFAMADAVSTTRDIYIIRKGKIWKSIATYEDYQNLTISHTQDNIEGILNNQSYFTDQFNYQSNKDNVFIFDWTLESAKKQRGYAEAAADILAASLIKIGKEYPFLLQHLHFIGHSRGCVVNSEAIERLIYWASSDVDINLDNNIHMTTLDAHPAGRWNNDIFSFMHDDYVNSANIIMDYERIGVVGWKSEGHKVTYLDNYWEDASDCLVVGLSNYPGLNSLNTVCNNDLTDILPNGLTLPHQLVHTWYHGTVALEAINDNFGVGTPNIERESWYNSALGGSQGFYNSINRSGNLSSIMSVEDDLIDVFADGNYGENFLIFNGNFIQTNTGTTPPLTPGWSYQDGVSPYLIRYWFNPCAQLTTSKNVLMHNTLLIPKNVQKIHFRMKVNSDAQIGLLKLFIGEQNIWEYSIDDDTGFKWYDADIQPPDVKGTVNQIKFELTNPPNEYPVVLIDDVSFTLNNDIFSSVACPVNFNIYDNLGNHTGLISDSTYVEEIPGSRYYVYEDSTGEKIKTVYLKPLEGIDEYYFKIESRDTTSYFSYIIQDYSDTFQSTITYEFDSIAIEPNTVASCTLNTNIQTPLLKVDLNGDEIIDSIYYPVVITTSIDNDESNALSIPRQYELFNSFPNPFNPSTTISYSIPELCAVTLKVYDILGNEIKTLVDEEKSPGYYKVQFNANSLSSGIYFYQLKADSYIQTRKMILVK